MVRSGRRVSIGGGVSLPYPEPTSKAATTIGRANSRKDTKPEIVLRSLLHRAGLRFRTDYPIGCGNVRVRPDVVFTRARVAVFVDGCFWHRCPDHRSIPRRNSEYWIPKLSANVARDRRVDEALTFGGWHVERLWEHEDPNVAAHRIVSVVRDRRRQGDHDRRS